MVNDKSEASLTFSKDMKKEGKIWTITLVFNKLRLLVDLNVFSIQKGLHFKPWKPKTTQKVIFRSGKYVWQVLSKWQLLLVSFPANELIPAQHHKPH